MYNVILRIYPPELRDDPQCPKCDSRLDAPESIISPGFINLHCIAIIDLQPNYLDTNTQINRSKKWFDSNTNIMSRKEYEISARYSIASIIKGRSTTFCAVTAMATKKYDNPNYLNYI